ncbi:MAG: hypothetical protein KDE32_08835 [Novosphingobium sp.]|nr:hypothetical protein [Novosphingobium sp.]
MSAENLEIIQKICVLFFGLCCLIWICDLVFRIIRDDVQRKILNTTLGGSLLAGIVTVALPVNDGPEPVEAEPVATGGAADIADSGDQQSGSTASPDLSARVPADTRPGDSIPPCGIEVPGALKEWAKDRLGEAPDFKCATRQTYPPCIEEIREGSKTETSRLAAKDCGERIFAFRREFVTPVYAAKVTYQDNLTSSELSLRTPRSAEDEDRRDYVVAELERLNGKTWEKFADLDRQSSLDMAACHDRKRRCFLDGNP